MAGNYIERINLSNYDGYEDRFKVIYNDLEGVHEEFHNNWTESDTLQPTANRLRSLADLCHSFARAIEDKERENAE